MFNLYNKYFFYFISFCLNMKEEKKSDLLHSGHLTMRDICFVD